MLKPSGRDIFHGFQCSNLKELEEIGWKKIQKFPQIHLVAKRCLIGYYMGYMGLWDYMGVQLA